MDKKTKFVIYGQGRTGSTLLADLLNSHDLVDCHGEIFNDRYWKGFYKMNLFNLVQKVPTHYLSYRAVKSQYPTFGFKLLDYQTLKMRQFIDQLSKQGWQIIRIQRRSIFKMAISNAIASQFNKWKSLKNDQEQNDRFAIDKFEFCGIISWIVRNENVIEYKLRNIKHHNVTYEDDLENDKCWSNTCNAIFDILEIPSSSVTTSYRRTDTRPYEDQISNYQDLVCVAQSLGLATT